MNNSDFLIKIRDSILNDGTLTSILLNCQVLSHEIKLPALSEWVSLELNGYYGDVKIPEYRRIRVSEVKAIFVNRFGTSITQSIPFGLDIPEPFASDLYCAFLPNSVSELEDYATKCKNDSKFNLTLNLHGSYYAILENCFDSSDGLHYSVQKAWQVFAGQCATGILTSIRSKILEFVCQLGETYDYDLTSTTSIEQTSMQIFNSVIYSLNTGTGTINNNDNNVALGDEATININSEEKAQLTELWNKLNNLELQVDRDNNELAEYLVELKREIDKKITCPSAIRKTLRAIKAIIGKAEEVVIERGLDQSIDMLSQYIH